MEKTQDAAQAPQRTEKSGDHMGRISKFVERHLTPKPDYYMEKVETVLQTEKRE
ncbi:Uncharacterised protein [uncultured archaeon]|nr:Uncharacterised protein [uncultured archaeon]